MHLSHDKSQMTLGKKIMEKFIPRFYDQDPSLQCAPPLTDQSSNREHGTDGISILS